MGTSTKREGIWFVAEFDGHRGVLARYKTKANTLTTEIRGELVSAKGRVETVECFDFFCPLRPVVMTDQNGNAMRGPDGRPQQGITRDPLVTGNHFILEPAPCYVNLGLATKLSLLDELSETDQANYDSYARVAREKIKEQVDAIKAANSLIVMPKDGLAGAPIAKDGTIDMGAMTRSP